MVVFNKFDRLIVELGYDSRDAYERVRMLLHEVNGLMSAFESEKFISWTDVLSRAPTPPEDRGGRADEEEEEDGATTTVDYLDDVEDDDDEDAEAFNIARGNVAFGSAIDGWRFDSTSSSTSTPKSPGVRRVHCSGALRGLVLPSEDATHSQSKSCQG